MQNRTPRVLLGVIVASILALVATAFGVAVALRAFGSTSNLQPTVQATPAVGVMNVSIHNYAYQPAVIQVVWGTTVTWKNQDAAVHSVILPHIIDSENDIRESGPLAQGKSFDYTFLARGTFQYYCAEHPNMVGIVMVT